MYKAITMTFNIRRAVLFVAIAGLLLSVAYIPLQTTAAQTQEEDTESEYVSEDLVQRLEELRALVEQLVALVEQVRGSSDTGSTVSSQAQSLGDGIVRVFVGNDLETIRYRENRDEALSVCMDAVQLLPQDDGYGVQNAAYCTYNGETIYSGSTQDMSSDNSAFDGSRSSRLLNSTGNSQVGSSGSELPDLVVSNGEYERTITDIRFHYTIENIGDSSVADNDIGMLLEVDISCNGGVDYIRETSAKLNNGEVEVEGFYYFTNSTFINNYLFQNPGGCFGYTVDYLEPQAGEVGSVENDGRILESNEDNNFSGWIDFGNYDGNGPDGAGGVTARCPDGYYWDDKETLCVDTSQSNYQDGE